MMIGIFLVLFGTLLLLDHLHVIDIRIGSLIAPILFIALGVSMILKRRSKKSQA